MHHLQQEYDMSLDSKLARINLEEHVIGYMAGYRGCAAVICRVHTAVDFPPHLNHVVREGVSIEHEVRTVEH